jgi:phosphate acetyltransferase
VNLDALTRAIESEGEPLRTWRQRAGRIPQRILLPERDDERVLLAAAALRLTGLAHPLLLGDAPVYGLAPELIRHLGPECWLSNRHDRVRREVTDRLWRRRRHRGMTQGEAYVLAADPLHQSLNLLGGGEADGVVVGAVASTADVARAALWALGVAPGVQTVSGAFVMLPPEPGRQPLLLADCAVVPEPSVDQLVEIAGATAHLCHRLLTQVPAVAFLSFSTAGSANHAAAHKMARAAALLSARYPEWQVVGEVQADAALVPEVARAKGIHWGEADCANVLIFPDLASGNISSKLVERLGGWRAVGPFLQGLQRPVCDLSRGCSALDIVDACLLVSSSSPRNLRGRGTNDASGS